MSTCDEKVTGMSAQHTHSSARHGQDAYERVMRIIGIIIGAGFGLVVTITEVIRLFSR